MSSVAQKKTLKDFIAVTHVTEKVATTILSNNGWRLQDSIDDFYSNSARYTGGSSSSSSAVVKVDRIKLEKLYEKYATGDSISEEKLGQFFQDVGVDPASATTFGVAWQLKAKNFGEFSKKEFVDGFAALGCDTIEKMKTECARLDTSLKNDRRTFKEFYRWLFDFIKDEGDRKTIDADIALDMWNIVLPLHFPLLSSWISFIRANNEKNKYKIISKDVWEQVFELAKEVKPDFSNYDENEGAWPVILDEFVEYQKKNSKK